MSTITVASVDLDLVHDPIFAAMLAHLATAQAVDARHAAIMAVHPDVPDADHAAMNAALLAEIRAINAMVATAPTTQAGLQAFAEYLREPRQRAVENFVEQTFTVDGRTSKMWGEGGSEKLIAQRTAELG